MTFEKEFEPLTPAEQKFLNEADSATRTTIGDGELPVDANHDNTIRAAIIRRVLLGDTKFKLNEKGVRLRGAWISGVLDLQGCDCANDVSLSHCHIAEPINAVNAGLRGLHVSHSVLHGLSADNANFSGSIYIRAGTMVHGEISLAGARIGGDLQICETQIETKGQDAVFAPSLRVDGSVFLGNYPYSEPDTSLVANGTLFFSSAQVSHDVFVSMVAISLSENLTHSGVFVGTEEHGRDIALSFARARVGGILYFQDNQISRGIVNLSGATVARLKDEPIGPGASYPIRLDGFRYTDFSRHADISLKARLEWLERRPKEMDFVAQPYEQLAQVLSALGHRNDARSVLMRKEQLLRAENRRLMRMSGISGKIRAAFSAGFDGLLRTAIGYGYRPNRAVLIAVVLIVLLGAFFQKTWQAGDMTPNSAPILISEPWVKATQIHPENPALFWSSASQAGQDWETFNAFAYAADLLVPIVTLGQESAWAPSTSRSPWGRAGWWLRWIAKAVGWIITALGAAAITGIIRQD